MKAVDAESVSEHPRVFVSLMAKRLRQAGIHS